MKVTVLAGGVGGARMALGFARSLPPGALSVVVNVGDDERFHGLQVCPDLDTVLYTLSGRVDPAQGWGVAHDGTRALEVLRELEAPGAWMKLGDADLGLHLYRSARLAAGEPLTTVMEHVRTRFGLGCALLPTSDDPCPTLVDTEVGVLRFQEWFVRDRAQPTVRALDFSAARAARITDQAREALRTADLIVFAPSNPLLSIQPMLEVGGFLEALREAPGRKLAVSPLVGGLPVKGPLAKLMQDLGRPASQREIAAGYAGLVERLVIDTSDAAEAEAIAQASGLDVVALPTLITEPGPAAELARALMALPAVPARAH